MHELSVTENVLAIAQRHAAQAGAKRVTAVYLVIGQLSSIIDDSVQFYWDIISADSLCASAKLHFERIPARLECQDCGEQYTLARELTNCPTCQSFSVKVLSGQEFYVSAIDIEGVNGTQINTD
jgi:hydrogenase nickel incorporation protein HypA/HybF